MKNFSIEDLKNNTKKVYAFGDFTNNIASYLKRNGVCFSGVLDNDENKWGKEVEKIKVSPVDVLSEEHKDGIFVVITNYTHWDEMEKQISLFPAVECVVALRDLQDFNTLDYQAFCEGIDLHQLKIDTLHLELSSVCNCKCIYCPFHGPLNIKKNKGLMSWDTLEKVLEVVHKVPTIETLDIVGNGELFLNKEWYEMTSYALERLKIKRVIMYTNGMLLKEENVRKIKKLNVDSIQLDVSLDGKNAEENDCYRLGSVYKIARQNVLRAQKMLKNDSRVRIVVTNCYPIERQQIPVDRVVKQDDVEVPSFIREGFLDLDKVSKWTLGCEGFDERLGLVKERVRFSDVDLKCLDLFHRLAIDAFGKMVFCSCWQGDVEVIADVFQDDIISCWFNNDKINYARNSIINGIEEAGICEGCPRRGFGEYILLAKEG